MHYSKLDYEEILKKLKPHLIKDQFQLLNQLNKILRGKIRGHSIYDVARILAELDENVKKALSHDAISDLVSVQPMAASQSLTRLILFRISIGMESIGISRDRPTKKARISI